MNLQPLLQKSLESLGPSEVLYSTLHERSALLQHLKLPSLACVTSCNGIHEMPDNSTTSPFVSVIQQTAFSALSA